MECFNLFRSREPEFAPNHFESFRRAPTDVDGYGILGTAIHPAGMKEGNRGLSVATPPESCAKFDVHPGRGARAPMNMPSGVGLGRFFWHPSRERIRF